MATTGLPLSASGLTFADASELDINVYCPNSVATNGQLLQSLPGVLIVGVCSADLQAMGFALFSHTQKRLLQHDTDIFANYGDEHDGGRLLVCESGNSVILASTRDCSLQLANISASQLRVDADSRHDVSGQDDFSSVTISALELQKDLSGAPILRVTAQNDSELIVETFDFSHQDLEHVLRKNVKDRPDAAGVSDSRPAVPFGGEEMSDEISDEFTDNSKSMDFGGAAPPADHRKVVAEVESSEEDEPPPKLVSSGWGGASAFAMPTDKSSAARQNPITQRSNPFGQLFATSKIEANSGLKMPAEKPTGPADWLRRGTAGGGAERAQIIKSTPPKMTEPLAAPSAGSVRCKVESPDRALPTRPPAVPAACGELIGLMEARINQLRGRLRQVSAVDLDLLQLKPSEEWLEIDKRIRDSKRVFEVETQLCEVTEIERSLDEAKDALAADLILWDTLVNANKSGTPADTLLVINEVNQAMAKSSVPAFERTWANSRRLVEGVLQILQKQDP